MEVWFGELCSRKKQGCTLKYCFRFWQQYIILKVRNSFVLKVRNSYICWTYLFLCKIMKLRCMSKKSQKFHRIEKGLYDDILQMYRNTKTLIIWVLVEPARFNFFLSWEKKCAKIAVVTVDLSRLSIYLLNLLFNLDFISFNFSSSWQKSVKSVVVF